MERWRLIDDGAGDGPHNMAVDEALLLSSEKGMSPPTLRLYGWTSPTISIGYLQDSAAYATNGLPVVRRITGGRAVLHGSEVTYSIVSDYRHPLFSGGVRATYLVISNAIAMALAGLSVRAEIVTKRRADSRDSRTAGGACFSVPSRYEIVVDDRKLVGSAQKRLRNSFLQHGSIPFEIDEEMVNDLFGEDTSASMAWMASVGAVDIDKFKSLLLKSLEEAFAITFYRGTLTDWEEELMREILKEKYGSEEWNLKRTVPGMGGGALYLCRGM